MRPDELLLVSDELRDVDAARAAGVPLIAVGWGYSSPEALERAGATVVRDVAALREALLPSLAEISGTDAD